MTDREYRISVTSPHGKQSLDQFEHWIGKVSQDAKERWGIQIEVSRVSEDAEHEVDFQ